VKWNGIIKDGEKGGNHARVRDGAVQVRVIGGGGGGGTVDSVARAAAAAAQATADAVTTSFNAYTQFAADGTPGAEVVVGKAPNGATLYRRDYTISNGPSASPITYAHGITGLLTVERMWGRLTRIATNDHIPLPYVHVTVPIQLSVSGADIAMNSSGNFGAFSGIIYLEYTRS
jgi:hypothetical protein